MSYQSDIPSSVTQLPSRGDTGRPAIAEVDFREIYDLQDKKTLGLDVRIAPDCALLAAGSAPGTGTEAHTALLRVRAQMSRILETASLPILFFLSPADSARTVSSFSGGGNGDFWRANRVNPDLILFAVLEESAVEKASRLLEGQTHRNEYPVVTASGTTLPSPSKRFVRIAPSLIDDIENDLWRQLQIKSMQEFASVSGISLIAQNVSTEKQLAKLIELKIRYATGPYIDQEYSLLSSLRHSNEDTPPSPGTPSRNSVRRTRIGEIASPLQFVDAALSASDVEELFDLEPSLPGVCVFKEEVLAGIITRDHLHEKLSGRYGFGLFANRPIANIMLTEFLSVDETTTVETAARLAMQRSEDHLYDFITVTSSGEYAGVVTIRDLILHLIRDMVMKEARPEQGAPAELAI